MEENFKTVKNKKIPSGSNWKIILNEIYNYYPHTYGESSKKHISEDDHILAKKLKITGYELMLGIGFLEDHKLIKKRIDTKKPYTATLLLTKDGFNIARENEKSKSNKDLQETIAIATILAASVAVFNFMYDILNSNPVESEFEFVIMLIILLFLLGNVYLIGASFHNMFKKALKLIK